MSETLFKMIALGAIHVPERLRAVDEDHALAIQASIQLHGLLNPITVRQTPNGDAPYTLVAGAHRLRAVELLDESGSIEAIVVKADRDEAVLIEIEENLFRNDLSVLDRAVFVQNYRDIWERTRGKIRRGNPSIGNYDKLSQLGESTLQGVIPSNWANIAQLDDETKNSDNLSEFPDSPVDLIAQEAANGFSVVCADRLGLSKRSVERLNKIAQRLPASVRTAVRGTALADNQAALLKLTKLPPEELALVPEALAEADYDFKKAMARIAPKVVPADPEMVLLSRLIGTWERAKPATRKLFLDHVRLTPQAQGGLK